MQKDPFLTLGVTSEATQNELYNAYRYLRDKYLDQRFAPGDEGAVACEKLDEIETAYREAEKILQNRFYVSNVSNPYEKVERLIKDRKLNDAQEELDNNLNRDAEWHYLQSMIFFNKRWYNEARDQLKASVNLDPSNAKYQDALNKLNEKLSDPRTASTDQKSSFYADGFSGSRSYRDDYGNNGRRGVSACDCCTSLICADCCCECMGGDLIACC